MSETEEIISKIVNYGDFSSLVPLDTRLVPDGQTLRIPFSFEGEEMTLRLELEVCGKSYGGRESDGRGGRTLYSYKGFDCSGVSICSVSLDGEDVELTKELETILDDFLNECDITEMFSYEQMY